MLKTSDDLKNKKQVWNFEQFTFVRVYIIIYLCKFYIDNASRIGTLVNMTWSEFARARQENGFYQAAVFNHKTIVTSGPANIIFSSTLYEETNIYYSKFLSNLVG